MKEAQELWNNIIEELNKNFDYNTIEEVFGDAKKVVKENNGLIYVLVPSIYIQKKISTVYVKYINNISEKISQKPVRFKFVLQEEFLKEEQKTNEKEVPIQVFESNLNSSYTFDSFIVGPSNMFSQRNALLVAEQPGVFANPLYIFGGVGLGKTHLMEAIGNYILDKDINTKVLYIQSQNFINEFVKASQNHTMDQFESKYANLDVLLVDDIQMLANGKKTQEEFFNLFNNMYNNHKQIVITSDKAPNQLKDIMDRLTTRFAWGLQVDINTPDLDLRVKILKRKLYEESSNSSISDDVLQYIASLYNNVRDLEGGLRRVLSYSVCFNRDIDLELVKDALENIIINKQQNGDNDKYENVKSLVSNFYNISIDDLISKKRTNDIVIPRHICMYILKNYYHLGLENIGKIMGGKNHSTVMHGIAKIEQNIITNNDLKLALDTLLKKLNL